MELGRPRIFILWLQWKLFRKPSVILIDHDGDCVARVCRGYGAYRWAKRFGFGIANVRLKSDGTTEGKCYVKRWEPLFPPDFKIK